MAESTEATSSSSPPSAGVNADACDETAATSRVTEQNGSTHLLLNSLDKLFELTLSGYAKKEDSHELLEKVITELVNIRQTFVKLDETDQKAFADGIGGRPEFMASLVPFMVQVYEALGNAYEVKCLCDWQYLLLVLAIISERFSLKIVEEGVHLELIKQLLDLPKAVGPHELLAELTKMAMYVMLTLIQKKELRHYFHNCCYTDVLITYVSSKNYSIGKLAKLSLSFLSRHLDHDQVAKNLGLTSSDVDTILKVLSEQELPEEEREGWGFLSKNRLILALKGFCSLDANGVKLVKQGGLDVLSNILSDTDDNDQRATLLLLWQLSRHSETVDAADNLCNKIGHISADEGSDLCTLKTSLPYCLLRTLPKGDEDCLAYAKAAYVHELYEECVRFCQQITESGSDYKSSTINTITLFHGKSSYYIFKQKLLAVKKLVETSPGYSEKRRDCFEDAKLAIHLLGIAYDANSIDAEGYRLLDTASMLAMSESSSSPRCLLCRSKQKKLARSHICPRAILDDFAKACDAPSSGKAFFVNWPWQAGFGSTVKSAGQVVIKLLCHDCESILSKNESHFLPKFFRKFYDKNDPTCIEIAQDIEYDEWLYQFCIGLIFRGMTSQFSGYRDEYLNEDEVYCIFVQCREALLNSISGPQVSMYIAPTAATDESELSSSLINTAIHHPFHFFFTQKMGMYAYHQLSRYALSYTFQIGMLMTTVKFSLADWTLDPSLAISPGKGVFRVLPNRSRRQTIPDPLWKTILAGAIRLEKEMIEQPQRPTAQPLLSSSAVPESSYMKSILESISNVRGVGKGSLLEGHPKIVDYIPAAITISHPHGFENSTGKVELPSGHNVLLHLTVPRQGEVGDTVFIVVGEGPSYGTNNPYLIFHHYEPGLQTNFSCFFSPCTFEFSGFLPDRNPKKLLDEAFKKSGIMETSKEIISLVLRTSGFRNYHSLLYWMQANRPPGVLDTKCKYQNDSKCWYCNESCEICLGSTVLGPAFTDLSGNILRFCSEECCNVYQRKPETHSQVFSPDDQENPSRSVPAGHKEYVHLSSYGKRESGSFIMKVSLCEGGGSETFPVRQYYLNYHMRTPRYHCRYEFFVSDDLQALGSVAYSGASYDLFEQDNMANLKKSGVNAISGEGKCSSVLELLEKIRFRTMAPDLASPVTGGNQEDKPQAAAKLSTDSAPERHAEESGLSDGGSKAALVVTADQLLALLSQCGGDFDMVAEKIEGLVVSGGDPGGLVSQGGMQQSGCGQHGEDAAGDESARHGAGIGGDIDTEKQEVQEHEVKESPEEQGEETDCKVQ